MASKKKKLKDFLILSLFTVVGILLVAVGLQSSNSGKKEHIIFSTKNEGGKVDGLVQLVSSAKGSEIKYTLDGSIPTSDSLTYHSPLRIEAPLVVRAQSFIDGMPIGQPVSNTYFAQRDYSLPIVSLITDPRNLWDPQVGVYTKNNFAKEGREWERPIHMQYFDKKGNLLYTNDLGFRIHGGSTRRQAQKGIRLTARPTYGDKLLNLQFFPNRNLSEFKNIILRASGNDWGETLIKDALLQSLVSSLSIDTQSYSPVTVFINGEYWGIYNVREYFDYQYFRNHYGTEENTVVVIHLDKSLGGYPQVVLGSSGDEMHYIEMLDFLKNNSLSKEDNFEYASTLMDISNFTDYFIAQHYFANDDALYNNVRIWRLKTERFQPGGRHGLDGRWRWLMYDTDHGFRKIDFDLLDFDSSSSLTKHSFSTVVIGSLLQNERFVQDLINRYADLLNTIFVADVVIDRINQMHDAIEQEIPFHAERWGGNIDVYGQRTFQSKEQWETKIQVLRDFAQNRPAIARKQVETKFGLPGSSDVDFMIEGSGSIKVSSLEVSIHPKNLVYFMHNPVPIDARPAFGYRFVGWYTDSSLQESEQIASNKVIFNSESSYVTAVFERNLVGKLLKL